MIASGPRPDGALPLGRLGAEGIDHSAVTSDLGRKTALAFLGMLSAEAYGLDFYRENVADTAIRSEDLPEGFLARVKVLAVTGTHFADEKTFGACTRIVELAAEAGCKIVLDIDLREALWKAVEGGLDEAARRVARLAECADRLPATRTSSAFSRESTDHALSAVCGTPGAVLIVKLGANGSWFATQCRKAAMLSPPSPGFRRGDPVSAGDAFLSSSAWIDGQPDAEALLRGNAAGALVVNRRTARSALRRGDLTYSARMLQRRSAPSTHTPGRTRRRRPERVPR